MGHNNWPFRPPSVSLTRPHRPVKGRPRAARRPFVRCSPVHRQSNRRQPGDLSLDPALPSTRPPRRRLKQICCEPELSASFLPFRATRERYHSLAPGSAGRAGGAVHHLPSACRPYLASNLAFLTLTCATTRVPDGRRYRCRAGVIGLIGTPASCGDPPGCRRRLNAGWWDVKRAYIERLPIERGVRVGVFSSETFCVRYGQGARGW